MGWALVSGGGGRWGEAAKRPRTGNCEEVAGHTWGICNCSCMEVARSGGRERAALRVMGTAMLEQTGGAGRVWDVLCGNRKRCQGDVAAGSQAGDPRRCWCRGAVREDIIVGLLKRALLVTKR